MWNFDEPTIRRGSHCYKWDEPEGEDIIPMWVADMDFKTAPAITSALHKRAEHGIFGYTFVPEEYYNSIVSWFARRHKWQISKEWIIYTSGVVPAISAIIKSLTVPGNNVIVQPPVYNCFFSSIRNNRCGIVENNLILDSDGRYTMDYEDLELKASDPHTKLLLLCNPHNPAGRVWTRDELSRLNNICMRHGVTVISDEIHCELVMPGFRYTPFASISDECRDNSITCTSPSKAFNTAGLQIANIISNNNDFRNRINRAINDNEVCDVNPFGVEGLMAAYNESEDWLDSLISYLHGNYNVLLKFFAENIPDIRITPLEGTYLVWADCRKRLAKSSMTSDSLTLLLTEKGRVMPNSGAMYGEAGEGFIRINIACPRNRMIKGLERMKDVINGI